MAAEGSKSIVEQFLDRVLIGRELEAVADLCRSEATYRMPIGIAYGVSGITALFAKTFSAFPDCRFLPETILSDGDRVGVRLTMRATLTGALDEHLPSGRRMVLPEIWLFQLSDGKISEIEVIFDTALLTATLNIPEIQRVER